MAVRKMKFDSNIVYIIIIVVIVILIVYLMNNQQNQQKNMVLYNPMRENFYNQRIYERFQTNGQKFNLWMQTPYVPISSITNLKSNKQEVLSTVANLLGEITITKITTLYKDPFLNFTNNIINSLYEGTNSRVFSKIFRENTTPTVGLKPILDYYKQQMLMSNNEVFHIIGTSGYIDFCKSFNPANVTDIILQFVNIPSNKPLDKYICNPKPAASR